MADVTKIETKDRNIYEVDGKRYRELSKEPAVGDTVLIVNPLDNSDYDYGDVFPIVGITSEGNTYDFIDENSAWRSEFVIVEPISNITESNELSRELTRLAERTEENHRNIITFSQMAESARSDASKAVGGVNALDEQLDLVREDIVYLDEKVLALEETRLPQNITININILDIESAKAIVESVMKGRE
ncbi:hypothetical protein COF41_25720 [Bacillus toyonensis]|uniref:hypothetical protein n=1 Tax=Bacillus toyonensis TaxID=155322 RepID=UPI000BFD76E7|nr:hypothetical protein [Bacillus toyonensis]MED2615448.1 hypothetical protein [Bacillus toyonensis]PHE12660.1 hypothetical protein COF41_25720 [Bacillus toyonensis]